MVGRHQEPAARIDEIDAVMLPVGEVGHRLQPVSCGPFLGRKQNRRRAIGERRRIGRRQRAVRLVEGRLKLGDLFEGDILAQIVVAEDARRRHEQIVEEARIIGGRRPLVAAKGKLILIGARDAPLLGHKLAMLPHGKAGARLRVRRRGDGDVAKREAAEEGGRLARDRLFGADLREPLGEGALQFDRRVRDRIGAGRDGAVDLSDRDFRRAAERRLQARAAGLGQRDARRILAKLRADDRFPREIEVLGVGYDRAAHHFVDMFAGKAVFVDEAVQGRRHEVEIGEIVIAGGAAAEGRANPADDGHFAQSLLHRIAPASCPSAWLEQAAEKA